MKSFFKSLLVFTILTYVVQFVFDIVSPVPDTNTLNLNDLPALMKADPETLLNAVSSFDTGSLQRTINITIVACVLYFLWPVVMYAWNQANRAIQWQKNTFFLTASSINISETNPLLAGRTQSQVTSFLYKGRNISSKPLRFVSAMIIVQKTGQMIPVSVDDEPPSPHCMIDADRNFILSVDFSRHTPPLTPQNFLKVFGPFKMVFSFNGKTQTKTFTHTMIAHALRRYR